MADGDPLRNVLMTEARALGFVRVGVTSVAPFPEARERGLTALRAGRFDGIPWMSEKRMERGANPAWRFPWARSLVSLAWPYPPSPAAVAQSQGRGRIAAYACLRDPETGAVTDYHRLLNNRLGRLLSTLRQLQPELRAKRFIDHGWAHDRAIAERAGVGFAGKNTCLITREAGSYVLLAAMLISSDLTEDRPVATNCGHCRACLPACPTGALLEPGVIDARRCISYLTIEHEGPIPLELRPLIGNWVFGCDLCQEACPINHQRAPAPAQPRDGDRGPVAYPLLEELLTMTETAFKARFAGTPLERSGRSRLARNCAVALGNEAQPSSLHVLRQVAAGDSDVVVREAASWAIGRIEAQEASAST